MESERRIPEIKDLAAYSAKTAQLIEIAGDPGGTPEYVAEETNPAWIRIRFATKVDEFKNLGEQMTEYD